MSLCSLTLLTHQPIIQKVRKFLKNQKLTDMMNCKFQNLFTPLEVSVSTFPHGTIYTINQLPLIIKPSQQKAKKFEYVYKTHSTCKQKNNSLYQKIMTLGFYHKNDKQQSKLKCSVINRLKLKVGFLSHSLATTNDFSN